MVLLAELSITGAVSATPDTIIIFSEKMLGYSSIVL